MRPGVDFLCQPGVNRQCIAIASYGLERLMRLGIFHHKLEMKGTLASPGALVQITVHQFGGTDRVCVAYCADQEGDGCGSATQKLIGHDARPDCGDPVKTLVAGKIFEWQECDALHRISSPGASGA